MSKHICTGLPKARKVGFPNGDMDMDRKDSAIPAMFGCAGELQVLTLGTCHKKLDAAVSVIGQSHVYS